jgi:transcriptional regulator with XRE-family HTH domain
MNSVTSAVSLEEVFPDLHAGSAIRGLRYRENLTQRRLAEKIGVGRRCISEMENGKRPVERDMAKRLAHALNTAENVFL